MMNWNPIDNAPTDGTPVLLWARLKSSPPEGDDSYAIVGFWHRDVRQWKVSPEHLNQKEELIASYWVALPEAPK
jgi:hypothetical protein